MESAKIIIFSEVDSLNDQIINSSYIKNPIIEESFIDEEVKNYKKNLKNEILYPFFYKCTE